MYHMCRIIGIPSGNAVCRILNVDNYALCIVCVEESELPRPQAVVGTYNSTKTFLVDMFPLLMQLLRYLTRQGY